jgi:hypothetical protein
VQRPATPTCSHTTARCSSQTLFWCLVHAPAAISKSARLVLAHSSAPIPRPSFWHSRPGLEHQQEGMFCVRCRLATPPLPSNVPPRACASVSSGRQQSASRRRPSTLLRTCRCGAFRAQSVGVDLCRVSATPMTALAAHTPVCVCLGARHRVKSMPTTPVLRLACRCHLCQQLRPARSSAATSRSCRWLQTVFCRCNACSHGQAARALATAPRGH